MAAVATTAGFAAFNDDVPAGIRISGPGASVAKDLELGRISPKVATTIYGVVWDPETFVVDQEATTQLRRDSRRARIARGKPYKEFLEGYVKAEPPKDLLYYGSWGDDTEELTATHFTNNGPERVKATIDKLPLIMLPDRREVKISALEDRIRELELKHGEVVHRKS